MSEPQSGEVSVCPQCGSEADWSKSSWCGSCGFYPAINRLVETAGGEFDEEIYENWWEAIPLWLWILAGGVVTIVVASIAARVVYADSPVRVWWTVLQLAVGAVAFSVAHLLAYLHGASRSDRVGPLDAFMKPLATWQPVLTSLPEKMKLLFAGSWGLVAVLTACFVIDGIDYDALFKARQEAADADSKRKSPMGVIIGTAQTVAKANDQLPGSRNRPQSLEEAFEEFTGGAGVEELQETDADELAEELAENEVGETSGDSESGDKSADSGAGGTSTASAGDSGEPTDETEPQQEALADAEADGGNSRPKEPQGTGGQLDATKVTAGSKSAAANPDGRGRVPSTSPVNLPPESLECVVIGYTTNAAGEPRSLLLAAPIQKRLQFVAKVSLDQIDPKASAGIRERLASLNQPWPVVKSPFGGRWTKPELFCEVRYAGWATNGRLTDPYITRFTVVGSPVDARLTPSDAAR